ncbi:hypothetical protein [Rivularia sp. UHCC 0363]|uniref:hypothetical protein n=1 Tax=Rivularia sp. UHCC 0363 TaxID=3110244 RepID=UPI002B1FBC70|nr:hypothetical protein [Rivularia sp. UHCC 0363]MEA5598619.1 hypothetical protein [Rivularia sp. UHCC 0363]
MKCINCGTDNNYKERVANSRRCKNCSQRFVFEPKTMLDVRFTDNFFAQLISDLSANNTLKFTEQQLFYLLNKRLIKNASTSCLSSILTFWGFIFASIGILFTRNTSGLIIMSTGILMLFGGTAIYTYEKNKKVKKFLVTPQQFRVYLNNWQSVNPIDGILTLSQQRLPSSINSDVTAYSFDRVVICDRAEVANLLIANNFHFENNCAVLSIDGYPANIFDTVMQMLRRNPDLKVYVLHDASPKGVSVVNTLSNNPDWFSNTSVTINDVGLLPRQMFNNSNIFVQISEDFATAAKELPLEIKQSLTEKEIQWLEAGKYVELESFTPQKILRVITQGISKSRQFDTSSIFADNGGSDFGSGSDPCDITIYADDCFG